MQHHLRHQLWQPLPPMHADTLNPVTPQGMQAGVGGLPVYPAISAQGGMHMPPDEVALMQSPIGPMPGMAGSPMMAPMPQHLASPLPVPGSETRLYVGAGKGVGEAALRHLFASIPGMLSCELQLDRTGHSRVRGRCAGLCRAVCWCQDEALAEVVLSGQTSGILPTWEACMFWCSVAVILLCSSAAECRACAGGGLRGLCIPGCSACCCQPLQ